MQLKAWKLQQRLYMLIGLGGVSSAEPKLARTLGKVFTYAIFLVSMALLFEWQLQIEGHLSFRNRTIINWFVWVFFIIEFAVLTAMVNNKVRYVRENWLIPVIILLGILVVFDVEPMTRWLGGARPALALLILVPTIRLLIRFFMDGQLSTTLLATAVIVVVFGLLVAGVDPVIKSAWDGIWWALATVSTVGYGDVVPVSPLGRLLGVGLIIMGLGVFVIITANFLALVLRRETVEFKHDEKAIEQLPDELEDLKKNQEQTLHILKNINERLQSLENRRD